ncbi:MAG: hypothetical protein WC758_05940 [Candidatus Woesearchaeota archaeon]|jgi:uncharacterized membrane protein
MKKKSTIIASLIFISFILLVISSVFYIQKLRDAKQLDPLTLEEQTKEEIIQSIYERHAQGNSTFYFVIPLFGFFGVVVGASIYFILNQDLEKKDKTIKYNTEVILKLLSPEEKKIVGKLLENDGKLQQAEITYMEGFTKVKAHRITETLVKKGIATKESLGKVRLIRLNSDLYNILKKDK